MPGVNESTENGDKSPKDKSGTIVAAETGPGVTNTNTNENSSAPRKRSKVSRACDACRRKKIRCDAELSSSLQTVTKICNNCVKNGEKCTFSRVPLKRGPSKGYIRDLEDKLENNSQTRKKSFTLETKNQPLPYPNSLQRNSVTGATTTSPPTTTSTIVTSGTAQSGSPIILPPLIGAYSQPKINVLPPAVSSVKNIEQGSNPSSPLNGILNPSAIEQQVSNSTTTSTTPSNNYHATHSPPIQGPFWKVPYEMPGNNNSNNNNSNSFNSAHNRKLSVDSISSNSSNGSRSRLPSLKTSNSISSDMGVSDSDDDFYSIRSFKQPRQSSQSLSPRNSISSLSSLNGRMNKNLVLSQQSHPHQQVIMSPHDQQAPPPQNMYYSSAGHVNTSPVYRPNLPQSGPYGAPQTYSKVPANSIEQNLSIYYAKFHNNFPILPFDQNLIVNILEGLVLNDQTKLIVELFNCSLTNLNNFQFQNINDNINLILRILQMYPFNNFGIKLNDNILILFFSSLILINYSILMNGDTYSLGISLTASILNDFKVLENFNLLIKSNIKDLAPDDIKLYLPKLYYCLSIMDNLHSLSFGIQNIIHNNKLVEFLYANLTILIPMNIDNQSIINFKISKLLSSLINTRDEVIVDNSLKYTLKRNKDDWNDGAYSHQGQDFASLFINFNKDKYDLIEYLHELSQSLNKMEPIEDKMKDSIRDYHLRLCKLIKKLSQTIINLANYISTISSQNSNTNSPGTNNNNYNSELLTPVLNISFGQSYKLIKLCKLVIDSLLKSIDDADLTNKLIKMNNDLSIAYNLLNSNLNKSFNPSVILGQFSMNLIKNKIEYYNLNFNVPNQVLNKGSDLNQWRNELVNSIMPFIDKEDNDGWY
ncbi:uncharacterized protein AC631_01443 [Debaryomyces fabryi]|uniref:Zn(2)-C6 fungal-type domain-containing protein n=1 Tax=Debaryomyces fabryi TaxID=58627 RepID=A0A0V1Q2T8_9ASCO|nr:uncharacterized protein AC631_01443 [Debaryomyces fabryi]KSA02846.1 hypothetical protein AC631_01443 [Debaryomyces fabryi]CUM46139.1 unnamed protein product [Debaryomyces fabryi]